YSRSVQNKDRTMRVEVDVYNRSEAAYDRFVAGSLATLLAPLGTAQPLEGAVLSTAGRLQWEPRNKSLAAFPPFPRARSRGGPSAARLLPGMTGYMELRLPSENAYLLPVSAVFSRGGKTYIMQVVDGTARLAPVEVQAEDGRLAKVAVVVRRTNSKTGARET